MTARESMLTRFSSPSLHTLASILPAPPRSPIIFLTSSQQDGNEEDRRCDSSSDMEAAQVAVWPGAVGYFGTVEKGGGKGRDLGGGGERGGVLTWKNARKVVGRLGIGGKERIKDFFGDRIMGEWYRYVVGRIDEGKKREGGRLERLMCLAGEGKFGIGTGFGVLVGVRKGTSGSWTGEGRRPGA